MRHNNGIFYFILAFFVGVETSFGILLLRPNFISVDSVTTYSVKRRDFHKFLGYVTSQSISNFSPKEEKPLNCS